MATIFRLVRVAVAAASTTYFGLVLALTLFTSFRLASVWVVSCALMLLLSLVALLVELDEFRSVPVPAPRTRQPSV